MIQYAKQTTIEATKLHQAFEWELEQNQNPTFMESNEHKHMKFSFSNSSELFKIQQRTVIQFHHICIVIARYQFKIRITVVLQDTK